jgi:hypothetical protein
MERGTMLWSLKTWKNMCTNYKVVEKGGRQSKRPRQVKLGISIWLGPEQQKWWIFFYKIIMYHTCFLNIYV